MRKTVLAIVMAILAWPIASHAAVLRVKAGGSGDGSSWSAALGSVDTAMQKANVGDEIWVAAVPKGSDGIYFYYQSSTYTPIGNGEIFVKDGVAMYGGFNGTETSRDQRDPKTNVTSLLLQLRIRMLQDLPTVIDGFNFINGVDMVLLIGDVGSTGTCQQLRISNNVFKNSGAPAGAIYAYQAPFICSATIQGNTFYPASNPIYIPSGAPKILNNVFTEQGGTRREGITVGSGGNSSAGTVVANNYIWGMGVTINSSGVLVANNTIAGGISGPTLTNTFGIITNGGTTVVNNIVAFYGNGIFSFDFITGNHNLVYGNGANYVGLASPGAGDIQRDPLFAGWANGDLHLTGSSPAINAGDTSVVQPGWVDFDGLARVFPQGGLVDIGGSEYGSSSSAPPAPTNQPPQVSAPAANPNPVTGQTTQLSVTATDPDNDPLSYQWALSGSAPAAVSYSNQAGATTGITFSKAGSYTFQVTVNDGHGHSVTSTPVTVTVTSVAKTLSISPSPATVVSGNSQTLSASVADQFGSAMGAAPATTTWTLTPTGSTLGSTSGSSVLFTAGTIAQTYTVTAQSGSMQAVVSVTVTSSTTGSPAPATTIFGAMAPTTVYSGSSPVELGIKFRSDVNGTVTGVRFYKVAGDNTIHTGSLWSSNGTLLATGTFSGETANGWQTLNFSTPVTIAANTTYVASYHTSNTFYYSFNYLTNTGVDNAPLHALKDGVDGGNGMYIVGPGGAFPSLSYLASNYWADVVFSSGGSTAPPPSPPASAGTIFATTAPTAVYANSSPVELGIKFRSDVNGTVTGIRFYKASGDTSVHTGSLWSSNGTLLATGTFSGETSSGWQQLTFATPVTIAANTTYVASYHTAGAFYYSPNYLLSTGVNNAPLHALQNGVDGTNGVYIVGPGGAFPNMSYMAANYWADVMFN